MILSKKSNDREKIFTTKWLIVKIYNEKSKSIQENLSYKKINKEPEEEMYKRKNLNIWKDSQCH